jgi:hypothetical protein
LIKALEGESAEWWMALLSLVSLLVRALKIEYQAG